MLLLSPPPPFRLQIIRSLHFMLPFAPAFFRLASSSGPQVASAGGGLSDPFPFFCDEMILARCFPFFSQ